MTNAMTQPTWTAHWRSNFFTGLAVVLPVIISLAVLLWLFGTVARFTDTLLFFLPQSLTHGQGGVGPVRWYWSLAALGVAVLLVGLVGSLTRHYLGRQFVRMLDNFLLKVPLLNKIYGTVKQVNDAFSSGSKSSFKQVVLVEFPRPGQYSIGFLTSEDHPEVQSKTGVRVVSVFVPTTPNPTTGFLILQPPEALQKLDMSVAEGIKFIISLGSIAPEYEALEGGTPKLLQR
jgi:uncharacterized membrane protein